MVFDYPDRCFEMGIPLTYNVVDECFENSRSSGVTIDPKKFPLIFRPLEWWEHRKVREMPKYIKGIISGKVYKVKKWDLKNKNGWICSDGWNSYHHTGIVPATESEYLNQNK